MSNPMRLTIVDNVLPTAACDRIADSIRTVNARRAATWRRKTHVDAYGELPPELIELGIATPNNLVHNLLMPRGTETAIHCHDWDAFIFFPLDHPEPLWTSLRPLRIETVRNRLVLMPAGLDHWVNIVESTRLSMASEVTAWRENFAPVPSSDPSPGAGAAYDGLTSENPDRPASP